MIRTRLYVCMVLGILIVGIVMVGLAQERDDQGNPNSSAPFQTKQVFTGTFTIPIDAPAPIKLGSVDLSAYSSIRVEETLLESAVPYNFGVQVSLNRPACPVPFSTPDPAFVPCNIDRENVYLTAPFSTLKLEIPGTTVDLMAYGYTYHAVGGTAKIAVTVFGRP